MEMQLTWISELKSIAMISYILHLELIYIFFPTNILLWIGILFSDDDWKGVSLTEFTDCRHNLANNRQTRMLANLSQVGCYKHLAGSDSRSQCHLLQSAKENLANMAFFGLTEYQQQIQYLFERTMGSRFKTDFFQYNHTHSSEVEPTPGQRYRVRQVNSLDIELYQYAKSLFFKRLNKVLDDDCDLGTNTHNLFTTNDRPVFSDVSYNDYEHDEEDDAETDHEDAILNRRIFPHRPRWLN